MGIKENELRKGSLFFPISRSTEVHMPANVPFKVVEIKAFSVTAVLSDENPAQVETWTEFDMGDISPIPITPEILKKVGFSEPSEGEQILLFSFDDYKEDYTQFVYKERDIRVMVFHGNYDIDLPEIKYVHQLQNLYFVLTGEELNILL